MVTLGSKYFLHLAVVFTFGCWSAQREVIVAFLHHLHFEQRLAGVLLDAAHVLTAPAVMSQVS